MLHSFTLENFKPFGGRERIPLAPITLVYGPNSSGKSSIIQALLLLKQTMVDREDESLTLIPRGEALDLGSFRSLIHRHDLGKQLRIALEYGPEILAWNDAQRSGFRFFREGRHRIELIFDAGISSKNQENPAATLAEVIFESDDGLRVHLRRTRGESVESEFLFSLGTPGLVFEWADVESQVSLLRYSLARRPLPPAAEEEDLRSLLRDSYFVRRGTLPSRIITRAQAEDRLRLSATRFFRAPYSVLESFSAELGILLRSILHLGPLRSYPERHYVSWGNERDYVGNEGELTTQAIFLRSELTREINQWFKVFEVPYELAVQSFGDPVVGEIISLNLKDLTSGVLVGPSDVGFGIGQLLPIVVQGLISDGQAICVEQPEIHLHPRLQAHIADFLIETAALNKDTLVAPRHAHPNQWIVETHSEALMLRVQRRIREGRIAPRDVSVLYVSQNKTGSSEVLPLRLDTNGDFLDPWPGGFFEESLRELLG